MSPVSLAADAPHAAEREGEAEDCVATNKIVFLVSVRALWGNGPLPVLLALLLAWLIGADSFISMAILVWFCCVTTTYVE